MKVLKKAVERLDIAKEFTCACGALLLVSPGDIRSGTDDGDRYWVFTCPECGSGNYVKPWWNVGPHA